MLRALILYMSGGAYSLNSTPNDRFEKLFTAILFNLRIFNFCQFLLRDLLKSFEGCSEESYVVLSKLKFQLRVIWRIPRYRRVTVYGCYRVNVGFRCKRVDKQILYFLIVRLGFR